jgi:DNA-binding response OmpR family regulator
MAGEKILVADDDPEINELICLYLQKEGFKVISVDNGTAVFDKVREHQPKLIILDILMPGQDGMEVCRELRKTTTNPILFVSCKDDDIDKIVALGVGGDDYITKPFSPGELIARVKAHLRRNTMIENNKPEENPALEYPGLSIVPATHTVIVNGRQVALSAKEFKILFQLAQNPNRVFKNEQLFNMIWDADSIGDTRTVMVHISNLRKKIEEDPANPRYILTLRGVGYKFNA